MIRICGFDPQQGVPTREQMWQRVHPDDRDRVKELGDRTIREKVDYDVEYRFVLPDGTVKHIHAIGHPVLSAEGELIQVIGTDMDVTERKRAEETLRESKTRFRTFVDHAGDALFVLDLEHKTIIDLNRAACDSLGYTRQELIGKTPLAFHLDSDQAEMEAATERAAAGETVFDRHWHRRKDGSLFPVEVHTSLVSYGGRRFLLQVARDISDRLQAEEQRERLRQLEADLAHVARVVTVGELVASIAHEVNQPLTGIVAHAGTCLRWLAAQPPDMEEARQALGHIVKDGRRAAEVIGRIRALVKKVPPSRDRLDINKAILEVIALTRGELQRNSVELRTHLSSDLPLVAADRVQLQQVILNLIVNAMEAMSGMGDRPRELVVTTGASASNEVFVEVRDSGPGIDPANLPRLFDSFYTTKPEGMGMGLSISRSITEAHGGRLWATPNQPHGAVFNFTLPVEDDGTS